MQTRLSDSLDAAGEKFEPVVSCIHASTAKLRGRKPKSTAEGELTGTDSVMQAYTVHVSLLLLPPGVACISSH